MISRNKYNVFRIKKQQEITTRKKIETSLFF